MGCSTVQVLEAAKEGPNGWRSRNDRGKAEFVRGKRRKFVWPLNGLGSNQKEGNFFHKAIKCKMYRR
jgi:hypothetical protein